MSCQEKIFGQAGTLELTSAEINNVLLTNT
jgi:hypothetical protein